MDAPKRCVNFEQRMGDLSGDHADDASVREQKQRLVEQKEREGKQKKKHK